MTETEQNRFERARLKASLRGLPEVEVESLLNLKEGNPDVPFRVRFYYRHAERVIQHILAEPLRVNMDDWFTERGPQKGGPECGTVCCIGGWTTALWLEKPRRVGVVYDSALLIEDVSAGILGLTHDEARRLFIVRLWPPQFGKEELSPEEDLLVWVVYDEDGQRVLPGQPAYARRVVDRFRHFIATEGRE